MSRSGATRETTTGRCRVTRRIRPDDLIGEASRLLDSGFRLGLVSAQDEGRTLRIVYLFLAGTPDRRVELSVSIPADDPKVPSLGRVSFSASRFEREIHDLFGIVPAGHPLPHRLVRHAHWPSGWYPMRHSAGPLPPFAAVDPFPFVEVRGDGVYEVPVGPVHAGLIEPGHFRFSVVGESVIKLKARLWFTHRGVEKLFEGLPAAGGVELAERISGDSSVAHALAHCLAVEDALRVDIPETVALQRALLLEMERLYNHAADLGALANDVGFSLGNAHGLRIRESLLDLNRQVTGHRLLRGSVVPGGVRLLALPDRTALRAIGEDLAEVARLILSNTIAWDRFAGTSVLSRSQAVDLGCLGYVARASGVPIDARVDHPWVDVPVEPVVHPEGDVLARFRVRVDEFAASVRILEGILDRVGTPASIVADHRGSAASGVGIVEGWRGTVVHRVEIDSRGSIKRAKVVDPSWFNWPALPLAMRDTILPDFPVTNKSFNLSYAGNDL